MFQSTSIAPALCCSLLLAVAPASSPAQTSACGGGTELTLLAGVDQNDHVDATASPFQFRGRGLDRSVSVTHPRGPWCLAADAHYGAATLAAVQGASSAERLKEGDGGVAVLRDIHAGRAALAVGAALRGAVAVTEHAYADPHGMVSQFRFDFVSVEPAVQWREALGRAAGSVAVQVSSSALALADHPYGAVWVHDAAPHFRVASPGTLRTLNGSVSYASSPWHGLRMIATYRADGVRYDDVHPVRSLLQTVTLGAAIPLDSR
jgi:hypothetical protein